MLLRRIFASFVVFASCTFVVECRADDANTKRSSTNRLALSLLEPGFTNKDIVGSILSREVVRQAFLIAARDELGLLTRDRTLREEIDAENKNEQRPWTIRSTITDDVSIRVDIFRPDAGEEPSWTTDVTLPQDWKFELTIAKAEELSRNEFVDVLKQAGITGTPRAGGKKTRIPGRVSALLAQMNFVAQYSAIRQLHAKIRKSGESPALLAGLARGYANLGSLTEHYWSPAHNAFKARALLYAERLVHRDPESAWSTRQRAYVRTLIGRHATALDDLNRAELLDKEQKGRSKRGRKPPGTDAIKAFCSYERDLLVKLAAKKGPEQGPARYLRMLSSETTRPSTWKVLPSNEVLEVYPDCYRAIDTMFWAERLGTSNVAAFHGMQTFSAALYGRLAQVADLPRQIRAIVESPDWAPEDEFAVRLELSKKLRDHARSDRDRGEPSLEVVAQLIDETGFVQSRALLYFMRNLQGVETAETLNVVRPLCEHHPYSLYLETYDRSGDTWKLALTELAESIDQTEVEMTERHMLRDILNHSPPENSRKPADLTFADLAFRHANPVYQDVLSMIEMSGSSNKNISDLCGFLRELSPHLPYSIDTSIRYDWKTVEDLAAEWEETYALEPLVVYALAVRYAGLDRRDDAIRLLERQIKTTPEYYAYVKLAELYKKSGDEEKWLEAMETSLNMSVMGLEHSSSRVSIARHFMAKGDYERAWPYAEEAAESWAAWAMSCAQKCCEALEDWEAAETYVSNLSQRYVDQSAFDWLFWCHYHGQGDVEAATKFTRAYIESLGDSATEAQMRRIGLFHLLNDEFEAALNLYEQAWEKKTYSSTGLHAALICDTIGAERDRDVWLQLIAKKTRRKGALSGRKIKLSEAYGRFATLLEQYVRGGEFDADQYEKLMAVAPARVPTRLDYIVGRFLENRKDRASQKYLQRCATSPIRRFNRTLAASHLRKLGIEVGPTREKEQEKAEAEKKTPQIPAK